MPTSLRFCTTSQLGRWSGLLLIAALLPLLGPAAAPAFAADCPNEQPEPLPPSACDDATPPDTSFEPMSPAPNAAEWTKANDVTFTFAAVNTDPADTDAMQLECKLEGPSQAHDWRACDSATQQRYTDLEDTAEGQTYTFSVRAFDSVDRPWDYDDPTTLLANEVEVDDWDATPETATWKQDTKAPAASIFEGPYDIEGTGWPIVKKPSVTYLLASTRESAPVAYRCQLDGANVPCEKGELTLDGLRGGNRTFTMTVKDQAGNEDTSPASKQFVVPYNLTQGRNWTRKTGKGYFARDVMQTRRYGATIKFRTRNIQEFRLIAPAGPDLGKIQVRLGDWRWQTYDLSRNKATKSRYYVIRGPNKPLFSGRILIRSISRGKPVRVDALVFPPK